MAPEVELHPNNVDGKFFVNRDCIGCDHCSNLAPRHFTADEELFAYVSKQPVTPEEIALCEQALEDCPVSAIGKRDNPLELAQLPPRPEAAQTASGCA